MIVVVVDASVRPELGLVDLLARLQLAARRSGGSIRLRDASGDLRELLDLIGLDGVLSPETQRETEGREQLRIQVVVQPGDPSL